MGGAEKTRRVQSAAGCQRRGAGVLADQDRYPTGLNLHLLGATALTLLFGPWFAILGLGLALLLATAWEGTWHAFALNGLLMAVLPVTISWWIYRLVDSKLPNHFFIYVFLNAFVGAGVAVAAVGFAACCYWRRPARIRSTT